MTRQVASLTRPGVSGEIPERIASPARNPPTRARFHGVFPGSASDLVRIANQPPAWAESNAFTYPKSGLLIRTYRYAGDCAAAAALQFFSGIIERRRNHASVMTDRTFENVEETIRPRSTAPRPTAVRQPTRAAAARKAGLGAVDKNHHSRTPWTARLGNCGIEFHDGLPEARCARPWSTHDV